MQDKSIHGGASAGCGANVTIDDSLLARIIPLWIGTSEDGTHHPSLVFGTGEALINASTDNPCTGQWQLHLFSFSFEARQALQTLKLLCPSAVARRRRGRTGKGCFWSAPGMARSIAASPTGAGRRGRNRRSGRGSFPMPWRGRPR